MENPNEKLQNLKRKYSFNKRPSKPFVDGVNPEFLITFPMPETWNPEFEGFDINLACDSTFIYGRYKTQNMKEKY